MMIQKAQSRPKNVVFPEGEHEKMLPRRDRSLIQEQIAHPILLGSPR